MAIRYTDFAAQAAKQSSEREVIAVQIERKAEDCYKAEYARRHLGECYEGIISGVTQRGLFVELENGVEGFVPASSLTATGTTLTEGIRLSDPRFRQELEPRRQHDDHHRPRRRQPRQGRF